MARSTECAHYLRQKALNILILQRFSCVHLLSGRVWEMQKPAWLAGTSHSWQQPAILANKNSPVAMKFSSLKDCYWLRETTISICYLCQLDFESIPVARHQKCELWARVLTDQTSILKQLQDICEHKSQTPSKHKLGVTGINSTLHI